LPEFNDMTTDAIETITLPPGLVRKEEWNKYVRLSDDHIATLIRQKRFPEPIPGSPTKLRLWRSAEVMAYLNGDYPPKS
jgi:predicted DNA-binding transcriptional regulator AlpA